MKSVLNKDGSCANKKTVAKQERSKYWQWLVRYEVRKVYSYIFAKLINT